MSPQELVQELNSAGGEEKKQEFLQKRNKLIIFLQSHDSISNTWTPDPLQMHGLDWRLIWFFFSLNYYLPLFPSHLEPSRVESMLIQDRYDNDNNNIDTDTDFSYYLI